MFLSLLLGGSLENLKSVFTRVWFNIAMTSNCHSFASVTEIGNNYLLALPR